MAVSAVVGAAVVGTTVYTSNQQRKAQKRADAEQARQNELRKRQEDVQAFRANVMAERRRRASIAEATVAGVGAGIGYSGGGGVGGASTSLTGAISSYNSQFNANVGFTNQTNAFNQEIIDSNQRIANFQSKQNKWQMIGSGVSSLLTTGLGAYQASKAYS